MSDSLGSMHPPPRSRRWLVLALGWVLASCDPSGDDRICDAPDTPALASLCALDAALAVQGAPADRVAACQAIEDAAWRDGCLVQVAEQRAWSGDLPGAFDTCLAAPASTRTCLEQVAWLGVQGRVDATPASTDAADQVADHVATLPDPGMVGTLRGYQSARKLARAAAWHGIYAGSGSTDPTALQSATEADLPAARAALAWEAVRLLPADLPVDDVVEAVHDIVDEARPPVTGDSSPQACWTAASMPRVLADFRWKPVSRAFGSWVRFPDPDPWTDLDIAIYDAIVMHRGALPSEHIFALKGHPSFAVQKTAARHVALLAPPQCDGGDAQLYANQCAEYGWVQRSRGESERDVVYFVLKFTRKAMRDGLVPRLDAPEPCP